MRNPRVLAAIMIAAFSFVLIPMSARADDAQSLLAKHKAFVGWTYGDGAVRSLHSSGDYVNEKGVTTEKFVENRLGLAYRIQSNSTQTIFGNSYGFTGNLFWMSAGNGYTVPQMGDSARVNMIKDALFMEGHRNSLQRSPAKAP